MELSKREKRKIKDSGSHETTEIKIEHFHKKHKKTSKLKIILWTALIMIILLVSYSAYSMTRPGQLDGFAKCLTEKGAVMYGAMDWCKYTQAQKGMFGKSFKYINYREHMELPGIRKTPTWVVDGKWYENAQSFDVLAQATGCKL